jgi:hypothetical protein
VIPEASQQAITLLKLLEERARKASAVPSRLNAERTTTVRLVHTLKNPASGQISDFWHRQGVQAKSLVALAPFHSPNGAPVQRLADALDVPKIQVGLNPVTKIAPLRPHGKTATDAASTFSFVIPRTGDGERHLHAKVFEVQAKGLAMVVTGSINATEQSLESTKNIEISLARVLVESPFKWEDCEPADFVPNKYEPIARDENWAYMDAVLNLDGVVQGSVWSANALPVAAHAILEMFSEQPQSPEVHVKLTSQGRFSFRLPQSVDVSGSIQLFLHGPGLNARCWLSVEDELCATDQQRREKQAVRRILRGEFKNDDLLELLQIFVRASTPHVRTSNSASIAERQEEARSKDDEPFSFTSWSRSTVHPRQGVAGPAAGHHGALKAFIHWLNFKKQVPANGVEPSVLTSSGAEGSSQTRIHLPGGVNTDANAGGQMLTECIHKVLEQIPVLLREQPKIAEGPLLAMVAGSHAFNLALESPWKDDRAYQGLRHWLEIYSVFDYADDGLSELTQFALGVACLIVTMAKERGLAAPCPALKDLLLRMNDGLRSEAPRPDHVETALQKDVFTHVNAAGRAAAVLALQDLWQAKSLDQRIEELVENALRPEYKESEEDAATFPGGVQAVRAIKHANPKRRYHGLLQTERALASRGCPHCYQAFSERALGKLRANHIIVCPNNGCGKAIFHVDDEQAAKRVMELLKNA